MTTTFSASDSAKSGTSSSGSTPFDEIVQVEEKENARVQLELDAMANELKEAELQMAKKEAQAEEEFRETARTELKEFKSTDPASILSDAERQAETITADLQKKYDNNSAKLVEELANKVISPTEQ